MRCAVLNGDEVINIVVTSGEKLLPNWVEIQEDSLVSKGWILADDGFTPPPPATPEVPASVTMRQARLALLHAELLDDIESVIASLPSPQKEAAKIEWEYSQEVQRHNSFVSVLAPALGLTEDQTDNLFREASTL